MQVCIILCIVCACVCACMCACVRACVCVHMLRSKAGVLSNEASPPKISIFPLKIFLLQCAILSKIICGMLHKNG